MCEFRLTVVAAQLGGAPGIFAQDGVSTVHRSVVVGARMVRAEGFAALGLLALAVVTLDFVGVVDRSVAVRASNRVAVRVLVLSSGGIKAWAKRVKGCSRCPVYISRPPTSPILLTLHAKAMAGICVVTELRVEHLRLMVSDRFINSGQLPSVVRV